MAIHCQRNDTYILQTQVFACHYWCKERTSNLYGCSSHFSQIEIVRSRRRFGTMWSRSWVATGTSCEITNTFIEWNSSTGRATERGYMPDTPITRNACLSTFFRIRTTTTYHCQLTCTRHWNHCFYCIHTYTSKIKLRRHILSCKKRIKKDSSKFVRYVKL